MPQRAELSRKPGGSDQSRTAARSTPPLHTGVAQRDEADGIASLLSLQRTVGNQAVLRMLDQQRATRGGPQAAGMVQRHEGPSIANPAGFSLFKGKSKTPAEKKMQEIRSILGKSSAGKSALKIIDKYKVPIDLTHPGPGSVYQGPAPGKILIEDSVDAGEAAFILVHEAIHAEASNKGETANVMALGRAEYVKTMIDEETTATVSSIEAKLGMSKRAQKKVDATPVMQERYQEAYKKAYDAAIEAKKKKKEAEEAGKKAGWQSVNDAFYDGSLVTSNTGETYAAYYGSFWDRCHAPPAESAI